MKSFADSLRDQDDAIRYATHRPDTDAATLAGMFDLHVDQAAELIETAWPSAVEVEPDEYEGYADWLKETEGQFND